MINPDIRLIASDMDGTLLNSSHRLSDKFFPVFHQLRQHGIRFAAASGRQYFNLRKIFQAVENDVIFVAENGSYVVFRGQELLVADLEKTVVRQFIRRGRKIPGAYLILCGKKKAYIENTDPAFMAHMNLYFEKYEVVPDLMQVSDDQFLKFTVCDLAGSEKNSYPHYRDFENSFQVKVSGDLWLDISHSLANKGRALSLLQEKYAIGREQTLVFGDYLNDLEMMRQAHFSYAMSNAHQEVKKAARFVTGSNDEGGVITVLEKLLQRLEQPGFIRV